LQRNIGINLKEFNISGQKKGLDGSEHFYRLDLANVAVRNKVRSITSSEELDIILIRTLSEKTK